MQEVISALKIFKRGKVTVAGTVASIDGGALAGMMSYRSSYGRRFLPYSYELEANEEADLGAFWGEFQKAKDRRFLQVAVRRFGLAGDRDNTEDKLVDLIIAAESLFLTNLGDARDRGELRYRLSERFAFFLESDSEYSRRQLFASMRAAYDARSKIVHGDVPTADDLRLPNEGAVPIDKFVDTIEELLRSALRKAILLRDSARSLVDWNKLILGE